MPSREVAGDEPAALLLIVPPGFGTGPRERASAEILASLHQPEPAAGPTAPKE